MRVMASIKLRKYEVALKDQATDFKLQKLQCI